MGLYTEVRGWILINDRNMNIDKFNEIILKAMDISPRSNQCVASTVFNTGMDCRNYIFIGGAIKNYDNDWKTYFNFLLNNFDISDYKIEKQYEEDIKWSEVILGDE